MNRTSPLRIVLTIGASGCASATSTSPMFDELGTSHVTPEAEPVPADPARIHFHMNQRLDDLREVGDLLVAGKLAEAQALSFMLARPADEPTLPSWSEGSVRIAAAARSIGRATSATEACRLLPRIAEVCADCHDRMGAKLDAGVLDHARCQQVAMQTAADPVIRATARPRRREH